MIVKMYCLICNILLVEVAGKADSALLKHCKLQQLQSRRRRVQKLSTFPLLPVRDPTVAASCSLHSFIHSLDFKVLGPTMTIGPVV